MASDADQPLVTPASPRPEASGQGQVGPEPPLTAVSRLASEFARVIPVLPLSEGGETPLVPIGDATKDPEQVGAWWRQWPNANIGTPTGSVSGLLVFDVDEEKGGGESLAALIKKRGPMPPTVEHANGKRRLLFFGHPGVGVRAAGENLGPGLTLKADGDFTVLRPSIVDGQVFKLVQGPGTPAQPVPLPAWLLPTVEQSRAHKPAKNGSQPSDDFRVDERGVWTQRNGNGLWVCSKLEVTAYVRDSDNESWGRVLEWQDKDGKNHILTMPMSMLAGDAHELRAEMLSGGLEISTNPQARGQLTTYIQGCIPLTRIRSVAKVGWHQDAFVLPDITLGEGNGEKVLFRPGHTSIDHSYRTAGTLEEWQEAIGRLCSGNSRLVFAVSCAFAAPLLSQVGEPSGGFHFRGLSSIGKTTLLHVAGSVCGGGGPNGYIETWRTTSNALEATAAIHNDGLLCLDELQLLDAKEAGEIAYSLACGTGKRRMTSEITRRRRFEWSLLFLSSGEIGLAEHAASAGKRVRAGQEVRLCDLPADAEAGKGLFEDIHNLEDAGEFAEHLTQASHRVYGVPIREFLQYIVLNRPVAVAAARQIREEFLGENTTSQASGEVRRAASRFAIVAAAGELATTRGITGWEAGEAKRASKACFKAWLASRGTAESGDLEAAVRQVRKFLEQHGASRFQDLLRTESSPRAVINRAGFREDCPWTGQVPPDEHDERTAYYVLPEVFREEVCEGFDYLAVARALKRDGYLECDEGHLTFQKRLPEVGRLRVYAIKSVILEDN